jgi:hypothetical protein
MYILVLVLRENRGLLVRSVSQQGEVNQTTHFRAVR